MKFLAALAFFGAVSAAVALKCYVCSSSQPPPCKKVVDCAKENVTMSPRCFTKEVNGKVAFGCITESSCGNGTQCCANNTCNLSPTTNPPSGSNNQGGTTKEGGSTRTGGSTQLGNSTNSTNMGPTTMPPQKKNSTSFILPSVLMLLLSAFTALNLD